MRALVLGGTGFVGGAATRHLLAAGHEVAVLTRGTSSPAPEEVARLVADRGDVDAVRGALAGTEWDAVVDVSGFVMAAGGPDAFTALVDLLDGRVGRYVYVSSVMAYRPTGFFPWDETQPLREEPVTTYGGFKVFAEGLLADRNARSGFPATVARPAAVYGPGNNIYDMEAAMFHRLRRGLPVLLPHEGLVATSYGHVDDLAAALAAMAFHPAAVGEAFNVTGEGVTSGQYVATLADLVGVAPRVVRVPDAVVATLERPAWGHLFAARHHGVLGCEKASRLLGLPPARDFRTGHGQTLAWFEHSPLVAGTDGLRDPLWGAGFDVAEEAAVAAAVRGAP